MTLSKQRSPGYNRLAHQIGTLCRENIEAFEHYTDSHQILKRLQLESGVACEETAIMVDGYGLVTHRVPLSLSFDQMDEGFFRECVSGLCKHIEKKYWHGMEEGAILHMAELMP